MRLMIPCLAAAVLVAGLTACGEGRPEPKAAPAPAPKSAKEERIDATARAIEDQLNAQLEAEAARKDARPAP